MCNHLGVMSDMSMARRVAARYAARNFKFPPVVMDNCPQCGGEGILTEKALRLKRLCDSCWGTGTSAKSIDALQAQYDEIVVTYEFKYDEFERIKKKRRGRPGRTLGMMGRDLQTLNGVLLDRQETLSFELARVGKGKRLARATGAAAR